MNSTYQEEICREYPYFEDIKNNIILVSKETYDDLMSGPTVKFASSEITIKLLLELLNNSFAKSYVERCVNKEISQINMSYVINGDTSGQVHLSRTAFIRLVDKAYREKLITLTEDNIEMLKSMFSKMSYETFKRERNFPFKISIDGKEYEFPPSFLMEFIEMSDEDFAILCSDKSIVDIAGIPKEYIIYAAHKFYDDKSLMEYLFPEGVIRRISDLKDNKYIDIESINRYYKTDDVNTQKVEINDELSQAILNDMPDNLSKIEKAIYIYIKMCKILTYDEEFFALNQVGPKTDKHRDINFIKTITPKNNRVVCFEFTAIYAKFLESLGINYEVEYKNLMSQDYGVNHTNLEWRYHKFLVYADSSETLLGNDMMQAKLNQPLQGLKCMNNNPNTKDEFKRLVSRVYKMIAEKENTNVTRVESVETLEDLLVAYYPHTSRIREIPLTEKIDIIFNKLRKISLKGVDLLAYMLQLRKIIFTEQEQKENFSIIIIRNNKNHGDMEVRAVAIIVINTVSMIDDTMENEYFIYDSDGYITSIELEDLQERFDNSELAYIDPRNDPEISGVEKRGVR